MQQNSRVAAPEALSGESLTTENRFEQETMKPGEMQRTGIQKPESHESSSLAPWLPA
jgi:hypothetical protein